MTKFLEIGDVISIQKGMKVYANLPEKFIYMNRPLSDKLQQTDICVGQIRKNDISDWVRRKKHITEGINERFEWEIGVAPKEAIDAFVEQVFPQPTQESFNTGCFAGEYVVIATSLSGSSSNSLNPNNSYSDGHHVSCKKLKDGAFDPQGEEINFYQSGSFTAMIRNIQPVRKMKQTFIG